MTVPKCQDEAPHGWGNISVTQVEKSIEGEIIPMYEIKVEKESTTGNLFGVNLVDRILTTDDLGSRFNCIILLYSPVEVELYLGRYPDFSTSAGNSIKLEIGWNKLSYSGVVDKIDSLATPEVFLSQSQECIGQTFYAKCLRYIGSEKKFIPNLYDLFIKQEKDKELIEKKLIGKIESLGVEPYNYNMAQLKQTDTHSGSASGFSVISENNEIHVKKDIGKGVSEGTWCFLNFKLDDGFVWKKNHKYYVALDILVRKDTHSIDNMYSRADLIPKFDNSHTVGSFTLKEVIKIGERGLYKAEIFIDRDTIDSYPNAKRLYWQFGPKYDLESEFDATVYNICVYDLGEYGSEEFIKWDEINNAVYSKGLFPYESKVIHSVVAERTKKRDIELWGDSLTAQNYGKFLSEIIDENVFVYGFGGKTSTYIRDEFISVANKSRTQVIWVGRNNYHEAEVVVDDIRDMISHLGHSDFVIMCPPNGYYGNFGTNGTDGEGELKGGSGYNKFIELEKRLSEEYPSNFLNIRKAVIQGWRMGNVKLLEGFTQPNVGDEITISVSDAKFLTTYNQYDLERWGDSVVKKIRIGLNGNYDTYDVIELVDETHLKVRLYDIKNIQSGSSVENIIDSGGNNAVKYLRVVQNADYLCWLYDTTLSTFRKDGIHMSDGGLKLVAEIVERKLRSMNLSNKKQKKITILNGYELSLDGKNYQNKDMSVVGPIDCKQGISITWGVGREGILGRLCEYDKNGSNLDYWNPMSNPRTVTSSNSATTNIKASFSTKDLDYAYIYDETNKMYLWKGDFV